MFHKMFIKLGVSVSLLFFKYRKLNIALFPVVKMILTLSNCNSNVTL